MKHLLLTLVMGLVLACGPTKTSLPVAQKQTLSVEQLAATITQEELKSKLYIYASDEFEGRETGQPGQKKAVEYLKNHYIQLGVPSPLGDDDYFQEVPLVTVNAPNVNFSINGKQLVAVEQFASMTTSVNGNFEASEIIDLGYGIEDEKYSDYSGLDVKGKVILIRSGEPKKDDGTYVISGTNEISKWSNTWQQISAKRNLAAEKGVKMALFYYPEVFDWLAPRFGNSNGRIALKDGMSKSYVMLVNDEGVEAVFGKSNNKDMQVGWSISAAISVSYKNNLSDLYSENVIAYVPGSEKPEEYIVLSAHLDHEGVKNGEIYNGADDDGSGSVALLEIAEAFKAAAESGNGPKRSVVFLHVTGEEKGLLGSRYYTDFDPVFPLENTVANLNIDMIGRIDPKRESENRNYIYLIGSDRLSTELHELSEMVNSKYTGIELDYKFNAPDDPNRFYSRSDHYNFAKNNIPVIFYFNGTHDDYHRPSDTVEKIEYDLLTNRTQLIFHTAWELANRPERVKVDKAQAAVGTN